MTVREFNSRMKHHKITAFYNGYTFGGDGRKAREYLITESVDDNTIKSWRSLNLENEYNRLEYIFRDDNNGGTNYEH